MPGRGIHILFEDNHLLAVNKPAVLPTMGTRAEQDSLLTLSKAYLKEKYKKPGNVYLGVVSRLDAMVTGVALFARTSKAAARLSQQFRERDVQKTYWAIVSDRFEPEAGECQDWLRKNEQLRRMVIAKEGDEGAKKATLTYRTLAATADLTLLEIQLETGRKHQIRLQLAHRGHPLLGDRKYGSPDLFTRGISLHARRLGLIHPVRKTPLVLTAPVPHYWSTIRAFTSEF